jgi:hypothetical protein
MLSSRWFPRSRPLHCSRNASGVTTPHALFIVVQIRPAESRGDDSDGSITSPHRSPALSSIVAKIVRTHNIILNPYIFSRLSSIFRAHTLDLMGSASKTAKRKDSKDPPNPIRRRTNSWEQKNAIVYDVSSQRLIKEERRNVGGKSIADNQSGQYPDNRVDQYTRIEIPKRPKSSLRKDNVRLSLPVRPTSESEFLAEIKLSSLGYKVAFERFRGNIDEIWVKGVPCYVH